jgi:hypothetical protein
MRKLLGIAIVALALAALPATAQTGPGAVRGVVIRLGSGIPLDHARVSLVAHDDTSAPRSVETDSSGSFEFPGIPPGTYSVEAQRTGFFGPLAHDVAANFVVKDVVVTAQQTQQISLGMTQGGSISGRILDARGTPSPRARVMAIRTVYRAGRRSWYADASATSDENGNYRLFWLGVGSYFIYAKPFSESSPGSSSTESTTFYPGTNDVETATPVALREGADITGLNVRLQQTATGTVQIRVVDESGAGKQASFALVPQDRLLISPNLDGIAAAAMSPRRDTGEYELRGVRPGSYDLIAQVRNAGVLMFDGRAAIRVRSGDLQSLTIVVKPVVTVSARFIVGGNSAIDLSQLELQLEQRDRVGYRLPALAGSDPRATMRFGRVPSSMAVPVVYGPYPDAYVADLLQEGRSVFDGGVITIGSQPVSVDVVLNGDGSRIEGSVQGAPSANFESTRVVLVPESPRRANPLLYQAVNPDANGRFTLRGVAPGNYKVFAWESVPSGAWENAEFLAPFERQGKVLRVEPGIPASVSVDWIPKAPTPLLPLTAPSAPASPISNNGGGTIKGLVVRLDNAGAIAGARVTMQLGSGVSSPQTATTDAEGRFTFMNVVPGSYRVNAQHEAFLGAPANGRYPTATSATVVMDAEFRANDLRLTLIPGGVIAGAILDPQGQPLAQQAVRVSMMGNSTLNNPAGRPPSYAMTTNDLGQFRFARLEPGQYAIAVTSQPGLPGAKDNYVRTYYPGTTDSTRAAPITLAAGTEVSDVALRIQTGPVASVSGIISIDLSGDPLPANGNSRPQVTLTSFATDAFGERLSRNISFDASGGFVARGIPAGRYLLDASLNGGPGTPRYRGRVTVDVGDRDLADVAVVIRRGVDVQVELQGSVAVAVPNPARVQRFQLRHLEGPEVGFVLEGSAPENINNFTIPNVPAGVYTLAIPGTLVGMCVRDILQSGVSVFDRGIRVDDSSAGTVRVVLQPTAGGLLSDRTTQRCIAQ